MFYWFLMSLHFLYLYFKYKIIFPCFANVDLLTIKGKTYKILNSDQIIPLDFIIELQYF